MKLQTCTMLLVVLSTAFSLAVGHVCIPEERIDIASGKLRWSLNKKERCQCQGVVAPRVTTSKHQTCTGNSDYNNSDDSADLFFIDDLKAVTDRKNWMKEKLDILLQREECYIDECISDPCVNQALCHDRVGRYICQCGPGFEGINCEADIERPVIMCPENKEEETSPGKSYAAVHFNPNATDNSEQAPTVSCSNESGSYFDIGEADVTCKAVDEAGNVAVCQFMVSVKDIEPPVIVCPENQEEETDPGKAYAAVNFNASAMDNSQQTSMVSCSNEAGSHFEIGETGVICIAVDGAGNFATCKFKVSVTDIERPEIICPENQYEETYAYAYAAVHFTASATDNSQQAPVVSCSHEPGSHFQIGETDITCKAVDAGGNIATCQFTVSVKGICQPDWEQFGSFCYYFNNDTTFSYFDALKDCQDKHANLASIHSSEENEFLISHAKTWYWIGLNDIENENVFVWVDKTDFQFMNWESAQPDNHNNEDCVHLMTSGVWNDLPCYDTLPCLCKKPVIGL